MQKAIYLLFLIIGSFQILRASDVTVTATAATNGYANGQLFIQVDNSVTDFPLQLVIVYPNGSTQTMSLTNYTYQIAGLPAGVYTVQVTSAAGCLLSLNIEIQNCKLLSGTGSYLCTSQGTVCCKKVFLTGGDEHFYIHSPIEANEMSFTAYHSLSVSQYNAIATTLHQTALGIASDILANGSTPYDIVEQNELETNAPLVMKFDSTGTLIWVWYKNSTNNESEYRSSEEFMPNPKASSNSGFQVFPNPTKGNLNCRIDVPKEGVIKFELFTLLGRKLLSQSQYIPNAGIATFKIRETENIPAGIYFLKFIDIDNVEKVERVVFGD